MCLTAKQIIVTNTSLHLKYLYSSNTENLQKYSQPQRMSNTYFNNIFSWDLVTRHAFPKSLTLSNFQMFDQLKSVYEAEMELLKEEEDKRVKRSLATHSSQLQKRRDEVKFRTPYHTYL